MTTSRARTEKQSFFLVSTCLKMAPRSTLASWILAGLASLLVSASSQPVSQPNILLIFPDQWRYDWAGSVWGNSALRTPNFDAIVRNGTVFTRAYVASPLCAPSRSCLASGREYDAAGVPSNFDNDYPINQTTFYTILRDQANYHVMTCGKDDLTKKSQPGINGTYHAEELGFSDYLRSSGKMDVVNSKEPHEPFGAFLESQNLWDVHKQEWHGSDGDCQWRSYVCNKSSPLPDFAYEDNWIARNALTLLKRKPAHKPWFLQVNIAGPHPPFSITSNMSETVRGRTFPLAVDHTTLTKEQQQIVRQDYAAEIENIDKWIGEMVEYLVETAELDTTLVCVASDHGEMLGDHDDWGKSQPWQGSASVPFTCMGQDVTQTLSLTSLATWKRKIWLMRNGIKMPMVQPDKLGVKVGQRITQPVSTMDMAGTFLDYAGSKPDGGMTTQSLRPLLEGTADHNRAFISSGLAKWRAVVQYKNETAIYKLICCNGTCQGQPKNATHTPSPLQAIRHLFTPSAHLGDCASYPPSLMPRDCAISRRQEAVEEEEEEGEKGKPPKSKTTILLYNIAADSFEMRNLAQMPEYRNIVNDMLPLMPKGRCPVTSI